MVAAKVTVVIVNPTSVTGIASTFQSTAIGLRLRSHQSAAPTITNMSTSARRWTADHFHRRKLRRVCCS